MPESFLEHIRCYTCKAYLIDPPIYMLPNGNSICENCSMLTEETTQRQLTFEKFLSKFTFPCTYGCGTILEFGEKQQHENECMHVTYMCPTLSSCLWIGIAHTIPDHFVTDHSNLIKNRIKYKLSLSEKDDEGFFMICKSDKYIIFKFHYIAATNILQYHIKGFNGDQVSAKICLINALFPDNYFNITETATPFNMDYYYLDNAKTLSLNKYLPALEDPRHIILTVYACTEEKSLNHDLIQKLKCSSCRGYLLPPLFQHSHSSIQVCYYCSKKYGYVKEGQDNKLSEIVSITNFPCRWRKCTVIKPGCDLVNHETSCILREIKCNDCNNFIVRKNYVSHIEEHHNYECKVTPFRFFNYTIKFSKEGPIVKMYTYNENKELITILSETIQTDLHKIVVYSETKKNENIFCVYFKHDHCKIRSNIFSMNENVNRIRKADLPTCFQNDQDMEVVVLLND